MKKLSIVQGVQTAGLVLIALGVAGAISFGNYDSTQNSSVDVLSETTTASVMNMYVYYGEKTISEAAQTEAGYPNIVKGGGAAVRIDLNPVPPAGSTTITLTTNESCVLFNDGEGGGLYGQSKTDTINNFYTIAIGAVEDDVYEGEHYCKLIASLTSTNEAFNKQQQKLTFTVMDNDPKPEGYEDTKKTNQPVESKIQTETEKIETPTVKFVDDEGQEIVKDESEDKLTFKDNEPIYLKGNTIPQGEVKLYIYSEPQTATTTATDEGEWSYTISSIEPGNHRVEIEVTDPATGKTSERQEVLAFQVTEPQTISQPVASVETPVETNSSTPLYIIAGVSLTLLTLGIIGTIIWKKKHPHQEEASIFNSEDINNNIV